MKIETLNDLDKYLADAYKSSNFHDSRWAIEELKNKIDEKEIIKHLKKELKIRKDNEKEMNKAIEIIKEKYKPTNYYIIQKALDCVQHKYQTGEYVLCRNVWGKDLVIAKIQQLTTKGYKVFIGRKLGTQHDVGFNNVICLATNLPKIKEELYNYDGEKR